MSMHLRAPPGEFARFAPAGHRSDRTPLGQAPSARGMLLPSIRPFWMFQAAFGTKSTGTKAKYPIAESIPKPPGPRIDGANTPRHPNEWVVHCWPHDNYYFMTAGFLYNRPFTLSANETLTLKYTTVVFPKND